MFLKAASRFTIITPLRKQRFGNNGSVSQGIIKTSFLISKGGGTFAKREHASEEQYFRRKVIGGHHLLA